MKRALTPGRPAPDDRGQNEPLLVTGAAMTVKRLSAFDSPTGGAVMAQYLIEASYTPQSWSAQIDKPANAADRISPAITACGGTLECLYYAFGDRDVIGICSFPSPEEAAAFGLTIASAGVT